MQSALLEKKSRLHKAVNIAAACALGLILAVPSQAFDKFVVQDIAVQGTQRISDGTVYNYFPVSKGETLTPERAREAIRALYKTEFFSDISLERQAYTLLINVKERPSIAKIEVEGAKKLGGDELKENLKQAGLAEGKMFRKSLLDGIQQEIRNQYYANGRYNVSITPKVKELPNNRVEILVDVEEGDVTTIKRINFVGNTVFDDDTLREIMDLEESSWKHILGSSDQYSQQKLYGDLEKVSSFYQDRGYLKSTIEAVQVSVSPNREDMFITANINEGDLYKVGQSKVSGNSPVGNEELERLILHRPGNTFSRKVIQLSSELMTSHLANEGYAFAEIEPIPQIDDITKVVEVDYQVNAGSRVYIRHIDFNGNDKTNDETLRREMRFLEGDWFSQGKMQRSQARIQRLPYIESMTIDSKPVPGVDDQVDIKVSVTERAPGAVQFGVGYSESQGFTLQGSVSHNNFMGSGSRMNAAVNNSETTKSVSLSYTDPYYTDDGISRTISGFYRETDAVSTTLSSDYTTNSYGGSLGYSFPLSENNSWNISLSARDTAITPSSNFSSVQLNEFIQNNTDDNATFTTLSVNAGVARDTRNRGLFATKGSRHALSSEVAISPGDIEFYKLRYDWQINVPAFWDMSLVFNGDVGYSDVYGDTTSLPPYENFFAGGPNSVRGYRQSSLGPRELSALGDTNQNAIDAGNQAYGGAIRLVNQTELVLPSPLDSNNRSTRFVLFHDIGNVFNHDTYEFETSELRQSAGIGFYWLTPILGMMKFSYAFPLNEQENDRLREFQFTFGTTF